MKTIKYISVRAALVAVACLLGIASGKAQLIPNGYLNVDWQYNVPWNDDFAEKSSGWGMNFEGGYYVLPELAVGAFISYHTNNKYVPRQTLPNGNQSTMTTDQQHSIFQLPFGVVGRYRFLQNSMFEPYAALKLGPNYAKMSSYYYVLETYEKTWGFYFSPEIGVTFFPVEGYRLGIHLSLYYSYATNKGHVLHYSVDGLGNFGFRVGLSF